MTRASLTRASLRHYAATHAMVVAGVAVAVAVLSGALLVGASVRSSLRDLALSRLGPVDVVLSSTTFFSPDVAEAVTREAGLPFRTAVPIITAQAAVVHEPSRRVAGRVEVYGVDESFWRMTPPVPGDRFPVPANREAVITEALAAELGAAVGDAMLLRVAKPTDIPLASLQGRRDAAGERVRVTITSIIPTGDRHEFSLRLTQGPAMAVYVPLARLQQDLEVGSRVNTVLLQTPGAPGGDEALTALRARLARHLTLEDRGLRLRSVPGGQTAIESSAGYLGEPERARVEAALKAAGAPATRVLTYVATRIRIGNRELPYSTISGLDAPFTSVPLGDGGGASGGTPIWLNQWAADDLGAKPGDEVGVEYFLWNDAEGLETRTATFRFAGVVPMDGLGGDSTLTPDFPGMTDASDISTWDPPFPVDMRRVRPKDEDYWDRHRAAPKALVPIETAQALWGSRFGTVSAIRFPSSAADAVAADLRSTMGSTFTLQAVRADALAASAGTTDFGEYFLYFSFFLVVSALLIAYLFFALSVEQRAREVGLLAAVGFAPARVRGLLVREGAVLAAAGALLGVVGAIAYAQVILYGLRTWWIGAVGTTALRLHVDPASLTAGVVGAFVAGLLALWLGTRALTKQSTRALLAGSGSLDGPGTPGTRLRSGSFAARASAGQAPLMLAAALALLAAGAAGAMNATGAFFGAGGLGLIAGLMFASRWLRRPRGSRAAAGFGTRGLALSHLAWRPRRTVLCLALVAFACFLLVSVGAFRKDTAHGAGERTSGTGGYTLMAESVAPLMDDPNTQRGREELGLDPDDPALDGVQMTRVRLRPGDEASCLTLYRPQNPRLLGVDPASLVGRFTFARTIDSPHQAGPPANPWDLLSHRLSGDAVPAIADQTTLMYVLHAAVGDDVTIAPDGQTPITLRIVGALADSMLQSELIIAEEQFVRLFPRNEGYRVWLIDAPEAKTTAVTGLLEDRLADNGVDVVSTDQRLQSYHAVENTYLATFQALGALGLLLGTVGLGAVLARNVLERRREWGLLGAVGFTPGHLRGLVLTESLALVVGGITLGTVPALVAIAPALSARAQTVPAGELALVLAAVAITGVLASLLAVRLATRTPVVAAIKNE